jgi:hypothetical protein
VTRDEIEATVLRALGEIAPEADLGSIKPDVAFREQLDLDSMDAQLRDRVARRARCRDP